MASGHVNRIQKAEHRTAPTNAVDASMQQQPLIRDCCSACNFDPLSWGIGVQN